MAGKELDAILELLIEPGRQEATAIEWLERWEAAREGGRTWKIPTVSSQLSRLRQHDPVGVRFFTHDPKRLHLLLEVLAATPEQVQKVWEVCKRLRCEDPSARPPIVFDLADLCEDGPLPDAVMSQILRVTQGAPLVLVLTGRQRESLRANMFDRKPAFKPVLVPPRTDSASLVREAVGDTGLLVSKTQRVPLHQWVTAETNYDGEFSFEPGDTLELFAEEGVLPAPVDVRDRLSEIIDDLPEEPQSSRYDRHGRPDDRWDARVPHSPIPRRQMMSIVTDPETADQRAPRVRLELARAIGVEAVATGRERTVVALKRAGLYDEYTSAEKLAYQIERASRREVSDAVYVVDGAYHVINPSDRFPSELLQDSLVERHDVACRAAEATITAFRRLISSITRDGWIDDPWAEGVVQELVSQGHALPAVLHARASLFHSELVKYAPATRVGDWRSAWRAMMAQPLPEAQLLVGLERPPLHDRDYDAVQAAFLAPKSRLDALMTGRDVQLYSLEPGAKFVIDRSEPAMLVRRQRLRLDRGWESTTSSDLPACIPTNQALTEPDKWMDLFEHGQGGPTPTWDFDDDDLLDRDEGITWVVENVSDELYVWHSADVELALALRALRRASLDDAIELGDGRVLLPMGEGIAAVVSMRTHASARTGAALIQPFVAHGGRFGVHDRTDGIAVYEASYRGITIGPSLPIGLYLMGPGVRIDVRFVPDPWSITGSRPATSAPALASAIDAAAAAAADD